MEKLNFELFQYGAINPALLTQPLQHQYLDYYCASPHNSIVTPMQTPLLDPCLTPYTPLSLSMEDSSQVFLKQEELTPIMDTEQDMSVASYLYSPEQQDQQHLHSYQNGLLFPSLVLQQQEYPDHTCPICLRHFTRKFNLSTHMRTHDMNRYKPYACGDCSKRFDRKHDCKRHYQTVHQGVKSHPCKHCTSAFSRKDALARHMDQIHSNTTI